jgi:hypothetical protein
VGFDRGAGLAGVVGHDLIPKNATRAPPWTQEVKRRRSRI